MKPRRGSENATQASWFRDGEDGILLGRKLRHYISLLVHPVPTTTVVFGQYRSH